MERTKYIPSRLHHEDKVGKILKPSLILTSDWHLREDTPICRTDDFWDAQWRKVAFVAGLQQRHNCPVVHAGDLFDHWKPSPHLLTLAISNLPKEFYTVYGQHDLPQHNIQLGYKSGIKTLEEAGIVKMHDECYSTLEFQLIHFGQEPVPLNTEKIHILVWHHMTYITKPYPDAVGGMAEGILRKYSQFDLIVTGDNHSSFSTSYQGRLLVNPGNLTRQSADQIDYQPRVALWYAETNTIEWVNIPIQKGVISREHIDHKEQRDQRIDAFVSKLNDDYEVGLSFEQNLNAFIEKNNIREPVKELIFKAIEK